MQIVAKGKDAVLADLEKVATERAGQPGLYALGRDEAGNAILILAGHVFSGQFSTDQLAPLVGQFNAKIRNGIMVSE